MTNRKLRPRALRIQKSRYTCLGGPYNGCTLLLACAGTLPFTARNELSNPMTGYYDRDMRWVGVPLA